MIQRQRGKLSLPSAVFHSFIVLIGVLNFMSQFFIWASQTHLLFIKRKQRKSLPWRWFGYRVLISIKFSELLLWISPRFMDGLRGHIKNSKECFIRYPNTSKSVKKTRLRLVFSTHFSGLDILMKHVFSCLIYYLISSYMFCQIQSMIVIPLSTPASELILLGSEQFYLTLETICNSKCLLTKVEKNR